MIPAILFILFIHWLSDFVFQTDYQARNKSKTLKALIMHTSLYSLTWISLWPLLGKYTFYFIGITFIAHTFTDFFTSKLNAKLRSDNNERKFFISLGFDQFLHHVQLILTYNHLHEIP